MNRKMFKKARPARDALNQAGGIMDSSPELMQTVQNYPVPGVQKFAKGMSVFTDPTSPFYRPPTANRVSGPEDISDIRIPGGGTNRYIRSIYAEEGDRDGTMLSYLRPTLQMRQDKNYIEPVGPGPLGFDLDEMFRNQRKAGNTAPLIIDNKGISTGYDQSGRLVLEQPRRTFVTDVENPADLSQTGIASQLAIDKAAIAKFQAANAPDAAPQYVSEAQQPFGRDQFRSPQTIAEILAKQTANPDLVRAEGSEGFEPKMDSIQENAHMIMGETGVDYNIALKMARANAEKQAETDFVKKIKDDEDAMATRERVMGDMDQGLGVQSYLSKIKAEEEAQKLKDQQGDAANEAFERARRSGSPQLSVDEQMKNEVQNVVKNGSPEQQRSSLKELMAQFTDNAPKYKGMNMGLAIAKMGFAIAAGDSPDALTNIANGMKEGAEDLIKDAEKRDAFKRQVDLSALQYGLGEESKYRAEERAIAGEERAEGRLIAKERRGALQVTAGPNGVTYNGKTYAPYTDFFLNKADIYDNTVPDGIMSTSTITALGTKAKAQAAALKTLITNGTLKTKEATALREEYSGHVDNAIKAERSLGIIEDVMLSIGDEGITGLAPAIEDFESKLKTAFGRDVPEGGWTLETSRAKFRNVLQTLIPLSLGEAQSANSISNRDVEFLISAYFGDDALTSGSFNFVVQNDETILRNLGMIADIFQNGQKKAFSQMTQIEMQMLPLMQAGTVDASGVGVSSIGLLSPEQARLADTVSLNLAGGKQTPGRTVGASTGYSRNQDGILVYNQG